MAHKKIMKAVVADMEEKLGITCLMVLHEAQDILSWADSILVMKDGQIIQQGSPEQIYRQPVNEYCAGLFGEYNLIDGKFLLFAGINTIEKNYIVRPEQFRIGVNPGNTISGAIKAVLFWGGFYTLDVLAGGQLLRVRTVDNNYAIGDIIQLSISTQDVWPV
jgi:ABC-type Fe3+/spermidine/putrescine transport system ATPase subunit